MADAAKTTSTGATPATREALLDSTPTRAAGATPRSSAATNGRRRSAEVGRIEVEIARIERAMDPPQGLRRDRRPTPASATPPSRPRRDPRHDAGRADGLLSCGPWTGSCWC